MFFREGLHMKKMVLLFAGLVTSNIAHNMIAAETPNDTSVVFRNGSFDTIFTVTTKTKKISFGKNQTVDLKPGEYTVIQLPLHKSVRITGKAVDTKKKAYTEPTPEIFTREKVDYKYFNIMIQSLRDEILVIPLSDSEAKRLQIMIN